MQHDDLLSDLTARLRHRQLPGQITRVTSRRTGAVTGRPPTDFGDTSTRTMPLREPRYF